MILQYYNYYYYYYYFYLFIFFFTWNGLIDFPLISMGNNDWVLRQIEVASLVMERINDVIQGTTVPIALN